MPLTCQLDRDFIYRKGFENGAAGIRKDSLWRNMAQASYDHGWRDGQNYRLHKMTRNYQE